MLGSPKVPVKGSGRPMAGGRITAQKRRNESLALGFSEVPRPCGDSSRLTGKPEVYRGQMLNLPFADDSPTGRAGRFWGCECNRENFVNYAELLSKSAPYSVSRPLSEPTASWLNRYGWLSKCLLRRTQYRPASHQSGKSPAFHHRRLSAS